MPGFLSISRWTSLLTSSGNNGTAPETQPMTTTDGTDDSKPLDQVQSKQSEGARDGDTKKRPMTVESPEARPTKRQDMRSANEKRLMGDFSAPKSARQITLPKVPDSDEAEAFGRRRGMAHKPGMKAGHKPRNTLNDSPHGANAGRLKNGSFVTGYTNKKPIHRPNASTQIVETQSKRAITIPPLATRPGDEFDDDERGGDRIRFEARKRPRLEFASSKAVRSSSPVDLTMDDDGDGGLEIVGLNGVALRPTAPHAQKSSAVAEGPFKPFIANGLKSVSNMTSIAPTKSKRKSKDGPGSSQASSRGTPSETAHGLSVTHGHASQSAKAEILDAELENDRKGDLSRSARPPIKLGEGVDKVKKPRQQMSLEERNEDVKKSVEVMQRMSPRSIRGRGPPQGPLSQPIAPRRVIAQIPQQDDTIYSNRSQASKPQKLSQVFVRDEPELPKPKAKDRMKAESKTVVSRVSPIKDGSDSPDELAGEVTVGSQASRSVSPQKRITAQSGKMLTVDDRQESPSLSDLAPTQFHHGGRKNLTGHKHTERSTQADNSAFETARVRLQAFHATSCVHTTGDLMMQYDKVEKQIDLYRDGMPQIIPGKQQMVSIGICEARKFISSHKGHRVYLKGSISDVSNGHICITFLDFKGAEWFLDTLMELAGDKLVVQYIPVERLDVTFSTQMRDIRRRYDMQKAQPPNRQVATLAKDETNMRHEEEEIKFEPFEISRKSTRQSSDHGLFQKSPYFTDAQPRRSNRQPKQIKTLSSSPPPLPRWTQENKLEPWAHSVVYPPEGVRRVTVDFQDIERLDEGNFLNDNLISFSLRRIQENISPNHKDSVYFFNSFFYTALTSKNGRTSFNYDAVQRWTKTVDLLAYQYVVVPINNDMHWFVAIICNLPEISRRAVGLGDEDESGITPEDRREGRGSPATQQTGATGRADKLSDEKLDNAILHSDLAPSSPTLADGVDGVEIQAQTEAMGQLSLSQEDSKSRSKRTNPTGNGRVTSLSTSEGFATPTSKLTGAMKSKKRAPPPLKKYNPDQPTIIMLDSLGSTHAAETRNLKDYLRAEAEARRGMELDTKELQGMTAKGLPQQTNFCDCGVYLVGYVEEFAKDPRRFVTKVLTRQLDREADFASFDPSAKRDEIRTELLKLYDEQTADRKSKKSAKKAPLKGVAEAPVSSPTTAPRTNVKMPEPQMPSSDGAPKPITDGVPEKVALPISRAMQSKLQIDHLHDDQLEESIPRALEEPATSPATTSVRVKSCTTSAKLAAEDKPPRLVPTTRDDHLAMAAVHDTEGDLHPQDESEEEMLLDTGDQADGFSTTLRGEVSKQASSSPDMLSALNRKVTNNLKQLATGFTPNGGGGAKMMQQSSLPASSSRDRDIIDLGSEDGNEYEIPDSQEKQQAEPNRLRQIKRTRVNV